MTSLPSYANDQTVAGITLKGNSFDVKIGYNKRAAAKQDLVVILQDVEGTPLTDEAGASLISTIEGFVTSELTSEKALSVVLPTETLTLSKFYTVLFGESFEVYKTQNPGTQQQVDPFVKVINPEGTYKYIRVGSRIEIATGGPVTELLDGTQQPDGNIFETFIVQSISEIKPEVSTSGKLEVNYVLNADPSNERAITYLRRLIQKERSGTLKIEEQFASTSEVSSTLLGIDRAETQLGLFSNVSTYGINEDEFVFYTDNPATGPSVWSRRETEEGDYHYPARIEEVKNEGALRIASYPVPYTFPYPPLAQNIGGDNQDTLGLYNSDKWKKWQNFVQLGKTLYEYYLRRRDAQSFSGDPQSNYQKYNSLLSRFLPAINEWDDYTYYGGVHYNQDPDRYYKRISIWTNTWNLIKDAKLKDPTNNDKIDFDFVDVLIPTLEANFGGLRGTGTNLDLGSGSVENASATGPGRDLNPFKENWTNRAWSSAVVGGDPDQDDFIPGYSPTGGQYALLQSRQAFRYQPGRISGYTFGTRAFMDKTEGGNFAEWGIFNDFDEYVFRREGANFFIVRRSTIHYPSGQGSLLQELGLADDLGNEDTSFVSYYNKTIAGKIYQFQEIKLGKEKFNGDSLNGNGPSGYLLSTDEITMYKIEFGWYGAIGLRMYAYVPIENGEARWVVVHTFVIENKLNVPSMGDPFFKFKYEIRVGANQAPDLKEPQVLYKYGTSMYIDGGDEGTVNVFSETSDEKTLPSSGAYTSIFGIYPKTNIVSGGGVPIPNKKIIIPKQMSITSDGFAQIDVVRCTACQGSGYLYMPNVTAGTHGNIRKLVSPDVTAGATNTLTLAPLYFSASPGSALNVIVVSDADAVYLRAGDHLLDTDASFNTVAGVTKSRITQIVDSATPGSKDIYLENDQALGGTITVTFQPTFIVDETTRRTYGLEIGDFQSKVIADKIWNTYIGNELSGTYFETAKLLMYVDSDRHQLIYERQLDPTKIGTYSNGVFTPAAFFGDPLTDTFDVRLSAYKTIIGSPNPVSGPTAIIKFLNNIPRDTYGQNCDWRIGFTPNKPIFNPVDGELTGWQSPDGVTLTEERGENDVQTNITILPESEYVYLDWHPYTQSTTYLGFETGEHWRARILPFTTDFRIPNPNGSYSGRCSQVNLNKNRSVEVQVTQTTSSILGAINDNVWNGFASTEEKDNYLAGSTYFLTSETPIITDAGNPTGGQIAVKINGAFIKFFYDGGGTAQIARFQDVQKSYNDTINGIERPIYVVPVNIDFLSALDAPGGSTLITGPDFLISYNSVRLTAWFSQGDQYDAPLSYSPGEGSDGVFEFDAFPLYAFVKMRDKAQIRGAELHNIDLLGNLSTSNPTWKYNFIDGSGSVTYNAGTNNQTGELDVNGNGSLNQTPQGIDSLIPAAFAQVSRLSSSQIDKQGESLLRPGNTLTTLYINNETKTFDLTDVFGFDRKVITPDIVNTEAVFLVGRTLNGQTTNVTLNLTYVEQL